MASWMKAKTSKRKRDKERLRKLSAGPFKGWSSEYHARAKTCGQVIPPTLTLREDQSIRKDGYYQIILAESTREKITLFFSGMTFFIVYERRPSLETKRSIFYSSYQQAFRAYSHKRVVYVERVCNTSAPSPS